MRARAALALLAMPGCSPQPVERPMGDEIACALNGSTTWSNSCTIERSADAWIVHRPDGGFRRLRADADALTASDGADTVRIIPLADGVTEVAIAGDRYRIPADALR